MENWRGQSYVIIDAIERASMFYLRDKGISWHHAMRRLLPEVYFSRLLLDAINVEDKIIVLELVAIAVDYIHMHYKVAEYDSRK